jgi:hypothetical protein
MQKKISVGLIVSVIKITNINYPSISNPSIRYKSVNDKTRKTGILSGLF